MTGDDVIWRIERIAGATVSIIRSDVQASSAAKLAKELSAKRVVMVRQVHGNHTVWAETLGPRAGSTLESSPMATGDAIAVRSPGLAAVIRVADCVPLALVASDDHAATAVGLAAVVHIGRAGLMAGIIDSAVDTLRAAGADQLVGVIGPRVCGACYELPADLAETVASAVPAARSTTSWGTRGADIGAGVIAQLGSHHIQVRDLGDGVCTMEDDRWFSYRRQGQAAGRFAIAVMLQ